MFSNKGGAIDEGIQALWYWRRAPAVVPSGQTRTCRCKSKSHCKATAVGTIRRSVQYLKGLGVWGIGEGVRRRGEGVGCKVSG